MDRRTPDFSRVFANTSLEKGEADAVIELAFLMANANGDASIDELESFRALVKYVNPDADVSAVLDLFSGQLDRAESIEERVRAAAAHLTRKEARELAYKVVYAVAVFDLETNEDERDLEELVIDVLGLALPRVDELELEATQALST
jgi:tellurite resistance protein